MNIELLDDIIELEKIIKKHRAESIKGDLVYLHTLDTRVENLLEDERYKLIEEYGEYYENDRKIYDKILDTTKFKDMAMADLYGRNGYIHKIGHIKYRLDSIEDKYKNLTTKLQIIIFYLIFQAILIIGILYKLS